MNRTDPNTSWLTLMDDEVEPTNINSADDDVVETDVAAAANTVVDHSEGIANLRDDALVSLVGGSARRALPAPAGDRVPEEVLERAASAANVLLRETAARHNAIVLDRPSPSQFTVGLVNEWNVEARRALSRALQTSSQFIRFEPLTESQFQLLFAHCYGQQSAHDSETLADARELREWKTVVLPSTPGAGGQSASDVESGAVNYGQGARVADVTGRKVVDISNNEELQRLSRQPIEKITVEELTRLTLWYFIRAKASDWHLEHGRTTGSRIRYRIDGVLYTKFRNLPLEVGKRIGNSLTQMSDGDYSETTRKPQNKNITALITRNNRQEEIQLRYASLPTFPLPEYVVRSQSEVITDIHKLGLLQLHYKQIEETLSHTQGIFLMTGPTGSGKTNSLAAYRTEMEKPDNRKIIAMEDPIEIYSDRTSQMEINENNKWDDGFHGMLRSDPDIIIVGELRSRDSVTVAVEAATTGHLVFATFHTSNVESTFTRLMRMGVPPEQLSDSLVCIQAQRLVRTLCRCKKVDDVESEAHGRELYRPHGCPACLGIGFKGRTALPEILVIDEEVQDWMAYGMTGKQIVGASVEKGKMLLMEDVARAKVLAGETTFKEVERVAKFTEARSRYEARERFYEEQQQSAQASARAQPPSSTIVNEQASDADAIDAEFEVIRNSPESNAPLDLS